MRGIVLTRAVAWAASTDAGNASMRKANRTKWSLEDRNVAVDKFNRLLPHIEGDPMAALAARALEQEQRNA